MFRCVTNGGAVVTNAGMLPCSFCILPVFGGQSHCGRFFRPLRGLRTALLRIPQARVWGYLLAPALRALRLGLQSGAHLRARAWGYHLERGLRGLRLGLPSRARFAASGVGLLSGARFKGFVPGLLE